MLGRTSKISLPAGHPPRVRCLPAAVLSILIHSGILGLCAVTIHVTRDYQPARVLATSDHPTLRVSFAESVDSGGAGSGSDSSGGVTVEPLASANPVGTGLTSGLPPVAVLPMNIISVEQDTGLAGRPTHATAPTLLLSAVLGDGSGGGDGIAGGGDGDGGSGSGGGRGMSAYLHNPLPAYPRIARERGWQGTTVLRVKVLASGLAEIVEIAESSGYAVLDDASVKSVRQWRFVPARRDDQPVDSWVEVPVRFQLENS